MHRLADIMNESMTFLDRLAESHTSTQEQDLLDIILAFRDVAEEKLAFASTMIRKGANKSVICIMLGSQRNLNSAMIRYMKALDVSDGASFWYFGKQLIMMTTNKIFFSRT